MNPVGSVNDIVARFLALFPRKWASSAARKTGGVLYGVILAFATVHSNFYQLVQFAGQMINLNTATGGWIDTWVYDFFGTDLLRNIGESDSSFLARIKATLFQKTCTREALSNAVSNLTGGVAPTIVEPWYAPDMGGFDVPGYAFDAPGNGRLGVGWVSELPFQVWVYIPALASVYGAIPGFDSTDVAFDVETNGGFFSPPGDLMITQEDILNALNRVRAAGITVFVNFAS